MPVPTVIKVCSLFQCHVHERQTIVDILFIWKLLYIIYEQFPLEYIRIYAAYKFRLLTQVKLNA